MPSEIQQISYNSLNIHEIGWGSILAFGDCVVILCQSLHIYLGLRSVLFEPPDAAGIEIKYSSIATLPSEVSSDRLRISTLYEGICSGTLANLFILKLLRKFDG